MAQLCKKKKIRRLLHISQNKILSDTWMIWPLLYYYSQKKFMAKIWIPQINWKIGRELKVIKFETIIPMN
jgi:hypothetical protein